MSVARLPTQDSICLSQIWRHVCISDVVRRTRPYRRHQRKPTTQCVAVVMRCWMTVRFIEVLLMLLRTVRLSCSLVTLNWNCCGLRHRSTSTPHSKLCRPKIKLLLRHYHWSLSLTPAFSTPVIWCHVFHSRVFSRPLGTHSKTRFNSHCSASNKPTLFNTLG